MNTRHFALSKCFSPSFRELSRTLSKQPDKVKTAIVMLNMGGPPTTSHVHDFLLRLFSDREIIQLPAQSLLSRLIAKRRSPKIIEQYAAIGGGSPITHWTRTQGEFLIDRLNQISPHTAPHKLYIGFRYVHPLLETAINELEQDQVERVVAFSQYPQYSCTTSGSSFNAIARHYASSNLGGTFTGVETVPSPSSPRLERVGEQGPMELANKQQQINGPIWSFIDRWPVSPSLVRAFADNILQSLDAIEDLAERKQTVLLFSAHSIPLSVVDRGDPYPQEVAATVHAVMALLNYRWPYRLVWQSKVGPAAWLGPSTEKALHGLARTGHHYAMLVPIAFTSDHIETLYEMDVEYCHEVAEKAGMRRVGRVAALNDHTGFMEGLSDLVVKHLNKGELCTRQYLLRCPMCVNPSCAMARRFVLAGQARLSKWTSDNTPERSGLLDDNVKQSVHST